MNGGSAYAGGQLSQTARMDKVFGDLQEESFLCREDLERQLRSLKHFQGLSNQAEEEKKLCFMLDSAGIAYEKGRNLAYYEDLVREADLPSRSDMEERIVRSLFSIFEEYVSPEQYMKKIVDKCSNPEDPWQGDPLRLRILKQLVRYGGCLTYQTSEGCLPGKTKKVVMYGGEAAIKKYLQAKCKAAGIRFRSVFDQLDLLDDGVFEALNVDDIRKKAESGEITSAKAKEQIKARRKGVALLKLADDLAGGHFRTGGATRKGLYLFALVYNMTYACQGREADPDTDIEINLFEKYYRNNLMRFLDKNSSGSSAKGGAQSGEFDLNPSGQGINYKNFAETIYLYYIAKNTPEDYTPEKIQEKIRLSDEMINRIRNSQAGKPAPSTPLPPSESVTIYYKNLIQPEAGQLSSIFEKPEKEFEQFLCDNYNCNAVVMEQTGKDGRTMQIFQSPLLVEADQNAAKREYDAIMDDLRYELEMSADPFGDDFSEEGGSIAAEEDGMTQKQERLLRTCSYGLYFEDPVAFSEEKLRRICRTDPSFSEEKFCSFKGLLEAANRYMTPEARWNGKVSALFVRDAEYVTRTDMIVAFYYYFNTSYGQDGSWTWTSYADFCRDFTELIDPKLEDAHYQPVSGRNVFDMLVTFSSYLHLTMIG